ncbi:MAG: T9SS type A sorting domain-containing protein [Saprospiraceae bacterium]|nr:T9SS type A sorting domain-containing protein [Saprospiraceae bacterium]
MKLNLLVLITLSIFIANSNNAQSNFKLTSTDYVGAFSKDLTNDWTTGWTNFDPKNTNYPDPTDTITLNGMLSSLAIPGEKNIDGGTTLTLDASKVYLLKGFIVVRNGGKLVIPAGTIIRAIADLNASPKNYASIIVERGGKIEITGDKNKPVVISSAKAAGSRERGDWGGLLIAGRSIHNLWNAGTDAVQMEGFNNVTFDANLARFGGTDPLDNSGIISYLRLEFGGLAFEINKEINALTLGAVGSGTVINHVQASYSNDDSFEWFGGSVNSSHLIAWKGTDDDFDTDNGYNGISQFGLGVRDSSYYDLTYSLPSGASTSEGFESDNEATGTANLSGPYTSGVFSNYTMVGPVPVGAKYTDMNSVTRAAFRRGARIRRNSSLRIVNSIFMGYRNFLMIDGDSCVRNTNFPAALSLVNPNTPVDVKSKQISFANNLIVNTASAYTTAGDTTANGLVEVSRGAGCGPKLNALTNWVKSGGDLANNIDPVPFTMGTVLINPLAASKTPDFRPVSNLSPALDGANFNNNPVIAGFNLNPTNYVGAMSANDDWTAGWTNFDPKNTNYPDPTDTTSLNGMLSSLAIPGEKNIDGGTTLTLDASKVYLLKGFIVVRNGGKLVIPAGTIIRAIADLNASPKNYASIIVERGGKIEITGDRNNPVVISSAKAAGSRERGDWGGLLIAGRSIHNLWNAGTDAVQMEGFNNVTFDANLAHFGGTDPLDNSGIISYLRLEFGGLAFEINKEINALTLGSVGSGTVINHVQASYSNDDSFEWFGGSVNSSHLIAWKGTDDDFDTDNGYNGISQFGIGVRDSSYYDLTYALPSGSSTSEGFESDNEATGTANLTGPYTSGVFSNYTMVGPVPVGTKYTDLNSVARSAFRRGARIRRNSSLRIVNSIFMGYRNFLMIDGDSCVRNTNYPGALSLVNPNTPVDVKSKQISFANNLIVNTGSAYTTAGDTTANGLVEVSRGAGCGPKLNALTNWLRSGGDLANNIDPVPFTMGTVLINPLAASTTPDFRPVSMISPACEGANFNNNPVLNNLVSTHEEIENAKYQAVYPNPVENGILNFGHEVLSFGIFDLSGKLILHGFDSDHAKVNGLPQGIYLIKLEGRIQKFIVQ